MAILLRQRPDARQPVVDGRSLGQGQGRIVRDDPARLGRMCFGQIVRPAGQLRAGRCLHYQRGGVRGPTARQQVSVSEVGQQREPNLSRQRQRREEIVPKAVIVIDHSFRVAEE
jgi:hypothetical protein